MPDNLKQDVFCILPFVQTVVRTDGSMSSCCNISGTQNIRNTDVVQFWNSSEVAELRQKVLGDQPVPQCEFCYKQERVQGESMRIRSLRDYKFFGKTHHSKVFDYFGYAEKNFLKKLNGIYKICVT